ncbi:MAG: replication-associated recombination protein A [Clostridia bacterium]|nr:replication-associated recombination protein A [Clostridia bacterium]
MNLFDLMQKDNAPLAERMRPTTLDEFAGQEHIVGKNSLLRRAILTDSLGSCIFYGAPGCGKTTLANIIANTTKSNFVKLNAVSSGIADAKKVIEDAKLDKERYGVTTYLLLDECHRWNKAQSDCMLEAIEKGHIVFIGSTTENPFVSMTRAIVSRCRIFEFKPLTDQDIKNVLIRAIADKTKGLGNMNLNVSDEALNHFVWASDGDLRNALNALELSAKSTQPDESGAINVDLTVAEQSSQKKSMSIDESMYYDMLSAFCKSLRGSDSDAALYWAERLLQAGCDPMLILRRLVVHSSEDVGMADPQALVIATAAMTAYQNIGLPEGKIPLYNAIIYVCEAPKSNSVVLAKYTVEEIVAKKKDDKVPTYLMDKNFKTQKISGYKYPHDFGGWVDQQYLPDSLKDEKFYVPSSNGFEKYLVRAKEIKANKQENKKD